MEQDLNRLLRRLLRPLVGMLMRHGVGYIALRDLLKEVYVEEALCQQPAGGEPTDSTISLVTGINRREVRRLRERAATPGETLREAMTGVNMAARVVAAWVANPDFRAPDGTPLTLTLHDGAGGPDFDKLLRAARVDVRARTVIGELERADIVARTADGGVRLLRTAYTPSTPRDKMLFMGANIGDHLRAALHNLAGTGPAFIERALFHNGIEAGQMEALRPRLADMADKLLRDAHEVVGEATSAGTGGGEPAMRRLRLGVYYYEADAQDQS
ncbi:DUF6502 family protein [Acidocella sp.]|uniref:DUF6502 family protein n=1 Tax=Acidocella sp. TaxID=50710 RepID=UPI00260232D4|nr:DUF6502 family protein [Acidocella sp.]